MRKLLAVALFAIATTAGVVQAHQKHTTAVVVSGFDPIPICPSVKCPVPSATTK